MKRNSNIILPRNKYEAYRKYIATLRLLGHGGIADDAIKVYSDKIVDYNELVNSTKFNLFKQRWYAQDGKLGGL